MNDTWYIEVNGQLYGPYLTMQLVQMVKNNQITLQTLVQSAQNGAYYKLQDIIAGTANNAFSAPGTGPTVPPNGFTVPQAGIQAHPVAQPVQPMAAQPEQAYQNYPQVNAVPNAFNMAYNTAPNAAVYPAPNAVPNAAVYPAQNAAPNAAVYPAQNAVPNAAIYPTANAVPPQGVAAVPTGYPQILPQTQTTAPEMVTPAGVTPSIPPKNSIQYGLTSTMRDWIDRSNMENGKIVCPHCWGLCALESILFISAHPELVGDPLLGGDAATRFLPKFFTAKGTAFDERGMECTDMACPHCHLKIPNAVIDLPASFFSIVGAPASGKSYFLTAMIWQLRKYLPKYFNFSLFDTDPAFNTVLNNYERTLFLNSNQQKYVSLPKTELQGRDFSNQIVIENNSIDLPRPFVFTLSPLPTHPYYEQKHSELERSLVLYDNAGEHFETGRDSTANLATVHLVHSDGIIFLYDPLKDIRLRQGCSLADPQVSKNTANISNQMTIFTEMVARIHKYSNLKANEKYDKPLIMVIPKYDAWKDSFPLDIANLDIVAYDSDMAPYLNMDVICAVSFCLRKYLSDVAPDIVGLAEGFSDTVFFIPTSALGRMPEFDEEKSLIGIRPDHLSPIWAEVPFLLQLHLNDLVQGVYFTDDTIPYITQYQFNRGHIMFAIPGTTERHTLPKFYCGKTIYCDVTKQFYRLPEFQTPEPPSTSKQSSPESDVELADQEFWNN